MPASELPPGVTVPGVTATSVTAPGVTAPGETSSNASFDVWRLWHGLPALMARELPFGVTKLLVYAAAQVKVRVRVRVRVRGSCPSV